MTRIDTRWTILSHRAVVMENRALRVTVLPELGGRIWSIVYKPRDRELLWQNPRVPPQRAPFGAAFDNVWCGGWEEMFPTSAPGIINGEQFPDHGEVWSLDWDCEPGERDGQTTLTLRCRTPISAVEVEKRITLRADEPVLDMTYALRSLSASPLPYLFTIHPAFAVSPACRLDFPAMNVALDPSWLGTLTETPINFRWPLAPRRGGEVDLRVVPPATSREVFFFFGHDFTEGWFAITDTAEKLTWGMNFPPEFFRACGVFAAYGGWRDHHTLLVEPATAYPQQIEPAIEHGRAPVLAPQARVETRVTFRVQEGLTRTSAVSLNGEFRE